MRRRTVSPERPSAVGGLAVGSRPATCVVVGLPLSRDELTVRPATPVDCVALAELHAASMRRAYRGILPDGYLDVGLVDERLEAWSERLARPRGAATLVAERGAGLLGLAHVVFDVDRQWGSMLESLHVTPSDIGRGVGTALFGAVAEEVAAREIDPSLHLWVYEANVDACGFYDRLGGRVTGSKVADDGGGATPSLRYWWRDVSDVATSHRLR
jgi:GNAT superfamily N-acetyltransferase